MSFTHLPPEILHQVALFTFPAGLSTFALLDKRCYHVSEQLISKYKKLRDQLTYLDSDQGLRPLTKALLTLRDDPAAGWFVRKLTLYSQWEGEVEDYETGEADNFDAIEDLGGGREDKETEVIKYTQEEHQVLLKRHNLCPTEFKGMPIFWRIPGNEYPHAGKALTLLPLFPRLESLNLSVLDGYSGTDMPTLSAVTDFIKYHLRRLQHSDCSFPNAFQSLTTIRLDSSAYDHDPIFEVTHLIPLLGLPSLRKLYAEDFSSTDYDTRFRTEEPGLPSVEEWLADVQVMPHKAPLEDLQLVDCNIASVAMHGLLRLIQQDTLRSFQVAYHLTYTEQAFADHRPKQLVEALMESAKDSLETLSVSRDGDGLCCAIENDMFEEAFDDFSFYSYNAQTNLSRFTRLQEVCIEASVFLRGYGLKQRAINGLGSALGIDFQNIRESSPEKAQPLSKLLPPSLRSLRVQLTSFQRAAFEKQLKSFKAEADAIGRLKRFPALQSVVYTIDDDSGV